MYSAKRFPARDNKEKERKSSPRRRSSTCFDLHIHRFRHPIDARTADAERLGDGRGPQGSWPSSRAPWPRPLKNGLPLHWSPSIVRHASTLIVGFLRALLISVATVARPARTRSASISAEKPCA